MRQMLLHLSHSQPQVPTELRSCYRCYFSYSKDARLSEDKMSVCEEEWGSWERSDDDEGLSRWSVGACRASWGGGFVGRRSVSNDGCS